MLHEVCFAVLFAGFTPGWDGEFWLPPPLCLPPFPGEDVDAPVCADGAGWLYGCASLLWPGEFSEFPGDGAVDDEDSAAGGTPALLFPFPLPFPCPFPWPLPADAGPVKPAKASASTATPKVPLRSLVMPPTPPSSVLLYPPIG